MLRRILVGALALVTALGTALVLTPAPAAAHPGLPLNPFDPVTVDWSSARNLSPAAFGTELDYRRDHGFIPVDIDADASGANHVYAAVFQTNLDSRDWRVGYQLTLDEYTDFRGDAISDGFRPADFETYFLGGTRYYAALFVENVESYHFVTKRHITEAELTTFRGEQFDANRIIVDVDSYPYGNGVRYAAIAIKNGENVSWRLGIDHSATSFQDTAEDHYQDGYRFLVIDSVETDDGQRFTGLYVRNLNGRGSTGQGQLTFSGFSDLWHELKDDGYRPINVERYETEDGTRYLGVWRQN